MERPIDAADPETPPHATRRLPVRRLPPRSRRSTGSRSRKPLEIRVNGRAVAVTMRTPGDDEELALGFCVTEGLAPATAGPADDLAGNVVEVTAPGAELDRVQRSFYTSSSCGVCGKGALEAVAVDAPRVESGLRVPFAVVLDLPERLRGAQAASRSRAAPRHGPLRRGRRAPLPPRGRRPPQRDGQGRRLGSAGGAPAAPGSILCVSGRLSFELVQKAAVAGCPVLVAVGAPSTLAVELAEDRGITLCGFVRDGRAAVYTEHERITA